MIKAQVIFEAVDLTELIFVRTQFRAIPLLFREFFAMDQSSSVPRGPNLFSTR